MDAIGHYLFGTMITISVMLLNGITSATGSITTISRQYGASSLALGSEKQAGYN